MDGTCQLDEILLPSFFARTTFPFRMLRQTLKLHIVDPVKGTRFANVRATDAERRNQGFEQLIWFLFALGATVEEISENLELYRQ